MLLIAIICLACSRPLFVSHLSAKGIASTKKRGYGRPNHHYFSRFICFDEKCLNKAAWEKKQRKQRFKGFKQGGALPSMPSEQKEERLITAQMDTAKRSTASPAKNVVAERRDSLIVLSEVLFEVNRYTLKPVLLPKLDSLAAFVIPRKQVQLIISGHTDNTGSESHNLQLSRNRARAVADYLVDHGVEPGHVSYRGYGSAKPVADNTSGLGRSRNRRVEILIQIQE